LYWLAAMRAMRLCAAILVALVGGCLGPGESCEPGGDEALAAPAITNNRLLLDREVEGSAGVGVSQVQALLEFHGSALADYQENGLPDGCQPILKAGWVPTYSERRRSLGDCLAVCALGGMLRSPRKG
jgi:hypothetical protein